MEKLDKITLLLEEIKELKINGIWGVCFLIESILKFTRFLTILQISCSYSFILFPQSPILTDFYNF